MAAIAGYTGQLKLAANTILTVTDWELDPSADMYDTTTIQNSRAKTYIAGLYGATISVKCIFDASDTNGVIAMQANVFATSPSVLAFTLSPNNGTNNYTGNAWVKDVKIHDPVNNVVDAQFTLQVTGAVAYA